MESMTDSFDNSIMWAYLNTYYRYHPGSFAMKKASFSILSIVFYMLLAAYTVSNSVWLVMDDAPPISDSIYYIQGSQTLIRAVQEGGLAGLCTIPDLVPYRPPLQSILGTSALLLLGNEPTHVLYLNVLWLSLTVWVTFLLVQRLVNPVAGLIAAMFLMSNSFLHSHLPMYESEVPMMVVVVSSFYCLERVWSYQSVKHAVYLGLLLSAGMLLKWIFFLILAAPVIIVFINLWMEKQKQYTSEHPIPFWKLAGCILLIPSMMALPWYVYQFGNLLAYQSEVVESNLYTPFVNGWNWNAVWYYPALLAIKLHFIHAFFLLAALGCYLWVGRNDVTKNQLRFLVLIASSVCLFWLCFAINTNNVPQKYLLPLQPLIALLAGLLLVGIPQWMSKWVWISVLLVFGGVMAYNQWGVFSAQNDMYEGEKSPEWLEPQTGFFQYPKRPPRMFNLPLKSISANIASTVKNRMQPLAVTTIPWLDRFNSFDLSVWLTTHFHSVHSNGINKYQSIPNLLFHDFIITSSGPSHREMTHADFIDPYRFNATVLISQTLRFEPEWFMQSHRLLNTYEYKDRGEIIRLYERTKPVDDNEVKYVIGMMIEGLLPQSYFWDQLEVVWGTIQNGELLERSSWFKNAYLQNDSASIQNLTKSFKRDANQWFPYERMMLYRLSGQTDLSAYSIVNAGPVLGWHPLTNEVTKNLTKHITNNGTQMPFRAYPVIPYPREVVSGYFHPEMNGVTGEFLRQGEKLIAIAPVQGCTDPISTVRLFSIQDINFVDAHSVIRQLQPLEDVPTAKNLNHGVYLAAGDIDGDGLDELIAGQTNSEESQGAFSVLDFSAEVYEPIRHNFVGFPPGYRGSGNVRVAIADLDGDGVKEIVAAADGNGFHISVISPMVENQTVQRFVRPANGVISVPKMDDWNTDNPVYIIAGEFDNNPANGEEVLLGLDIPDTSYRIMKIQYNKNNERSSEVLGMKLIEP